MQTQLSDGVNPPSLFHPPPINPPPIPDFDNISCHDFATVIMKFFKYFNF